MRMLGIIAYIMRFAVGGAIETVALATGDVDSIGETVFAQGISEIPEGFGMTGLLSFSSLRASFDALIWMSSYRLLLAKMSF
jgi:hypothetical protein